jgi:hypothetical protein
MALRRAAGAVAISAALMLAGAPGAHALPDNPFCTRMAALGYTGQCSTLVTLAQGVCTEYDRGASLSTVTDLLDARTRDQGLSNFIIAGAPMYFCPQHQNLSP